MSQNDNQITIEEMREFLEEIVNSNYSEDEIKDLFLEKFEERIENGASVQEMTPEIKKEIDKYIDFIDEDRRMNAAKDLLYKKYNREFEVLRYRGDKFPEDYYAVDAYEKEHPSNVFEVWVKNDESEIEDSYVMKLVCEDIKKRVINNLNSCKDNMSILVFSSLLLTSLQDTEIGLNEIVDYCPNNRYSIHLYFDEENEKQYPDFEDLVSMINGLEKIKGSINIFKLNHEKKIELEEYVNKRAKLYSSYWDLAGNSYKCCVKFDNGNLSINKDEYTKMFI